VWTQASLSMNGRSPEQPASDKMSQGLRVVRNLQLVGRMSTVYPPTESASQSIYVRVEKTVQPTVARCGVADSDNER
jgi:hypothetical protein